MSKEQTRSNTPITPDVYLMGKDWCEDNYLGKYYEWIKEEDLHKLMEQYAQAKVLEALEREDVKIYTGLRDLNGDRIYRGDVVQNLVEERGVIMYWYGAFCVAYFEEPAKEYLHTLTVTDKNYCSTGKVKLTKITKQK